ncbi:MAG TPA: hypothetical protein VEL05_01745 [Candidatus Acidoferrum sp.]|nr:hypothetical protein [Candidatus Acidoferrum sp.]
MDRPARLLRAAAGIAAGAAVIACGGASSPSPESEGGAKPGANALPYKRLVLSLELLPPGGEEAEADASGTVSLWLIETDETGSTRRVDLGELPGPCTVRRNPPGVALKPLFALDCSGGEGARVRLVYQRDQLIMLRAPGLTGDDFDFEESQRVHLPVGVRVLTE